MYKIVGQVCFHSVKMKDQMVFRWDWLYCNLQMTNLQESSIDF